MSELGDFYFQQLQKLRQNREELCSKPRTISEIATFLDNVYRWDTITCGLRDLGIVNGSKVTYFWLTNDHKDLGRDISMIPARQRKNRQIEWNEKGVPVVLDLIEGWLKEDIDNYV